MLKVDSSENSRIYRSRIDVGLPVAGVSVSEPADSEEMPRMELRPVPSDNTDKGQDEGEKVTIVEVHQNAFTAVGVIFQNHQT